MNGENRTDSHGLPPGKMELPNRLYLSLLVIACAIIPPRSKRGGQAADNEIISQHVSVAATTEEIKFFMGDLNRAVDRQGGLTLQFTDCLTIAAPFILFRLKRMGFSNSRVLIKGKGFMVTANR